MANLASPYLASCDPPSWDCQFSCCCKDVPGLKAPQPPSWALGSITLMVKPRLLQGPTLACQLLAVVLASWAVAARATAVGPLGKESPHGGVQGRMAFKFCLCKLRKPLPEDMSVPSAVNSLYLSLDLLVEDAHHLRMGAALARTSLVGG